VRELKNALIHEKEESMVHQMKRAEMNRSIMIQEKVRKAQEEEMKVSVNLNLSKFVLDPFNIEIILLFQLDLRSMK